MKCVDSLCQLPKNEIQTRWYSLENKIGEKGGGGKALFGRKGSACTNLSAGQSLVLADIAGSGIIRRIWITIMDKTAAAIRGMKIEMYWDGAATPAVQAPLGDFFCHSMGQMVTFENVCFSSPEGRTFNSIVPMPFRKSARIVLANESDKENIVYYDVDCTIGDKHDEEMLYFHSYWRRENPTQLRRDMAILPKVNGRGRFLGCNLGVRVNKTLNNFWWGEGEVKIYLDGDTDFPTLCGTGTEDYIGTGWGQGRFVNHYQGNHYVAGDIKADDMHIAEAYGFYRFHIPDPIYFYKDIRVDIQVLGGAFYSALLECMNRNPGIKLIKAGDGTECFTREELEADPKMGRVLERLDDHCATAYWYMDKPENGLDTMICAAERIKDL